MSAVSAYPNSTLISTRPGRSSAGSSFSAWLVVITSMRPSLAATPSMTLSKAERERPAGGFSTSSFVVSGLGGVSGVVVDGGGNALLVVLLVLLSVLSASSRFLVIPALSTSSSNTIHRLGRS